MAKKFTLLYDSSKNKQYPTPFPSTPDQILLEGTAAKIHTAYAKAFEEAQSHDSQDQESFKKLNAIDEWSQQISLGRIERIKPR